MKKDMQTQQNYVDTLVIKYNVDYKQAETELFEYIQRHRNAEDECIATDKLDAIIQRMTRAMQCRQQVLSWNSSYPRHIRFSEDSD
tara:strand:- start:1456 stop:1713 length:258 start_codon:yes stop_codon:yes gene_type:complete